MTKQIESDGISLDEQIATAESDYVQACQARQGRMADKLLKDRVNELRESITDLKRMRLDLKRISDKAANDARTAEYEAKKAQDAAALKARGVRLRRLDQALEELVRQYFSLNPGSFCTARMLNQIDLIKGRIVNESRGREFHRQRKDT